MPLQANFEEGNQINFCLRRTGRPATCPNIGNVFILNKGTTVVGRNPMKSDIYLDSTIHKGLISRLHARITLGSDNKVNICDTSLNGTYVNDRKILDTVDINPGDIVTFGHVKGAVLDPGTVAKQLKSEFSFKLERYVVHPGGNKNTESEKENTQGNKKAENKYDGFIPDLSIFMKKFETDLKDVIKTDRRSDDDAYSGSITTGDSTIRREIPGCSGDDNELLAFAVAAQNAMEEESDTELFAVTMPIPSPDIYYTNSSMPSSYSTQKQKRQLDYPCGNLTTNSSEEKKKTHIGELTNKASQGKSSKTFKRRTVPWSSKKRKQYKKLNKSCPEAVEDVCGFGTDCLCPHEQQQVVNWVQCDFCQKWYHLECAGLTLDIVTGPSKKFHCGCTM